MSRARLLLALYPASWRERYGAEYAALLEDTCTGPRVVLDAARGALDAWLRPKLLTGSRRLRTTATVVWCAWITVAAGALFFAKLTEDEPFRRLDGAHLWAGLSFGAFAAGAALLVLGVAGGAAPVAVSTLLAARRRRDRRGMLLLAVPVLAPAAFLIALFVIGHTVHRSAIPGRGIGAPAFVVVCALGVVAAVACAAAPARAAWREAQPDVAWRIAVLAAVPITGAMVLLSASSVVYAIGLRESVHDLSPAISADMGVLVPYALAMAATCAVAAVSTARGVRALLSA